MKVTGINELSQTVEYNNIIKKHEKAVLKDKVKQLMAQGINKETATVMAKVFTEYGF